MANALYALGKQALLDNSVDMATDTIKAVLVGSGYTPNLTTDEFKSDIPSGQIYATSSAFTGVTVANGVFDAANITFTAVPAGPACDFIVVYKDTGTGSTSRLIACLDTATGLPVTPNGGDISVAWDTGSAKIFAL